MCDMCVCGVCGVCVSGVCVCVVCLVCGVCVWCVCVFAVHVVCVCGVWCVVWHDLDVSRPVCPVTVPFISVTHKYSAALCCHIKTSTLQKLFIVAIQATDSLSYRHGFWRQT